MSVADLRSGSKVGEGEGWARLFRLPIRKQVDAHERDGHHGGRCDEDLGKGVHVREPPRRPPRARRRGSPPCGQHRAAMRLTSSCRSSWSHDRMARVTSRSEALKSVIAPPPGIVGCTSDFKRRAQLARRVMQARAHRPDRHAEDVGHLVERQIQVVVEDHHRSMVERKTSGRRVRAGRDRRPRSGHRPPSVRQPAAASGSAPSGGISGPRHSRRARGADTTRPRSGPGHEAEGGPARR